MPAAVSFLQEMHTAVQASLKLLLFLNDAVASSLKTDIKVGPGHGLHIHWHFLWILDELSPLLCQPLIYAPTVCYADDK